MIIENDDSLDDKIEQSKWEEEWRRNRKWSIGNNNEEETGSDW